MPNFIPLKTKKKNPILKNPGNKITYIGIVDTKFKVALMTTSNPLKIKGLTSNETLKITRKVTTTQNEFCLCDIKNAHFEEFLRTLCD